MKMASLRKRNNRWQVQIRRTGLGTVSKTFNLKSDALNWARVMESKLERGDSLVNLQVLKETTLEGLINRYVTEILPNKKAVIQETSTIQLFLKEKFSKIPLSKLTSDHFVSYLRKRLKLVKPDTVIRQFGVLRHMLNTARNKWDIPVKKDLLSPVLLPKPHKGRTRRLQTGERELILNAAKDCLNINLLPIVTLALETAMRQSEIVKIRPEHINVALRTLLIPETKNGKPRTIPLSTTAFDILEKHTLVERQFVFPTTASAIKQAWRRLMIRSNVQDLRFHDLRHEAISLFFEKGLNVAEVMIISGHTDHRMLLRYTHLEAGNLVSKLG